MFVAHAALAAQTGVLAEDIFVVENGDVLQFTRGGRGAQSDGRAAPA